MSAEADIDLYDAIEDDYSHEQEEELLNGGGDNANDLYDDVITSSSKEKETASNNHAHDIDDASNDAQSSQASVSGADQKYQRRWSVYISNLTWWTTDEDLIQACKAIGVSDVFDIKFYENRANGQSKGFATVAVKSAESMNALMEKVKTLQIHSQTPNVHYCNKQNLLMLDAATGGNRYEQEQERQAQYQHQPQPVVHEAVRFPRVMRPPFQHGQPMMPHRPPLMPGMAPRMMPRPAMPGAPPMGQQLPPGVRPPYGMPPRGIPGVAPPGVGPQGFSQGQPQGTFPPGLQPPGMQQAGVAPPGQQPPTSQPAAHINPAFFPGGQPPQAGQPVMLDPYGRPVEQMSTPPAVIPKDGSTQLSEEDFQDILTRNKSVSSSAISRAVQDASQGDFASAIETLVTAISLIKQSKIASDERCKILIASLQDTKQGIEDKSYGGGSSRDYRDRGYSDDRDRRRSRSRDRDRDRRRDRSRSRDRDRRDYRERSRERDRGQDRYYRESRQDRYY